jgi:hypothetical protein
MLGALSNTPPWLWACVDAVGEGALGRGGAQAARHPSDYVARRGRSGRMRGIEGKGAVE